MLCISGLKLYVLYHKNRVTCDSLLLNHHCSVSKVDLNYNFDDRATDRDHSYNRSSFLHKLLRHSKVAC